MELFGRKRIYINKENFQAVINKLTISFEALREEYILGSLSQLKRKGVDVSKVSREIKQESELEDLLKGFQLTSMIGIAWSYIKHINDQLLFNHMLSNHLNAEEGTRTTEFRERYKDCQGDMGALSKTLSLDVYEAIGSPEPKNEFLVQFQGGAYTLIGLCQMATYSACGDSKMEQKIKQKIFTSYTKKN